MWTEEGAHICGKTVLNPYGGLKESFQTIYNVTLLKKHTCSHGISLLLHYLDKNHSRGLKGAHRMQHGC